MLSRQFEPNCASNVRITCPEGASQTCTTGREPATPLVTRRSLPANPIVRINLMPPAGLIVVTRRESALDQISTACDALVGSPRLPGDGPRCDMTNLPPALSAAREA